MRVRFHCLQDERAYYEVVSDGAILFCGTTGECRRYIMIHVQKVLREEWQRNARGRADNSVRRARPVEPVTVWRRGVRAAP